MLERIDNVRRRFGQNGALTDKIVGPAAPRVARRTGDGKYFAALLERKPRDDQRTGFLRRLNNQNTVRESGNQPVPCREVPRRRPGTDRLPGNQNTLFCDPVL